MHRAFKRRSHSTGSFCDEPTDHRILQDGEGKSEDLEAARRLFLSLLHIKDASGRSYLHTKFHLSWAKALLDRARNLDEDSGSYIDFSIAATGSKRNGRHRSGSYQNKELSSNHAQNDDAVSGNGSNTFVQRRFLLQPDQESGYTPFHRAIIERNLAAILLFLRHAASEEKSTERLTQRPMVLLHAAEVHFGHNRNNMNKTHRNNNNLLIAMANAIDHEGMTPLRLLGRLQQSELSRCRNYVKAFRPSVDRNATLKLRTRARRSSFDNSIGDDSDDENVDYISENADLIQIDEEGTNGRENHSTEDHVTYGCEVVTFGRPNHYALGVVQGGSYSSSAFVSSSNTDNKSQTYSHGSGFCPQRVQEFAQETVGRQGSAMAIAVATHHSLVVTRDGHLYAFGLGKGGRLGLGDDQPQQCPLPKRVLGTLQRRQVVSVAAAENHSLCVTSQGNVYSWGSNRFGQLGDHGSGNPSIMPCGSRSVPRRVESLKQYPCVSVAAGEKHSVALSRKGEVYVWGDNSSGQLGVPRRAGIQKVQRVEALWGNSTSQGSKTSSPKITIAIAAAAQSTLVLTTGSPSSRLTNVNAIYEWGHGNHVPIKVHFESYKTEVKNKDNVVSRSSSFGSSFSRTPNPTAIACGRYHNAAITSDGMVYTWGLHAESLGRSNCNSLLKQNQHQRRNSSPQLVSGMLPENGGGFAVAIDASGSHTAVVCSSGALFTWGTTDGNHVLGHEGVRWQPNPKRVPGVHRAIDVAVAKEHTILLIGASFPSMPKHDRLQGLGDLAAHKVSEYVDLFNVIPILIMAERTQSSFLIDYCTDFVRRNLDGVLNVGRKSIMNQYLNDMLAETTYRAGKRYRDDHHHPIIFDVLAAGNDGRHTFDKKLFSSFQEWIEGCKKHAESAIVKRLLEVATAREHEEDSKIIKFKTRNNSSCQKEYDESEAKTRSRSGSTSITDSKGGNLDICIKRTANMDLSTIELVNENAAWLSKEIRGVRKKLKQISSLLDAEAREVVLTSEQKVKVARRPTLEIELSIYESAAAEITKRTKELSIENEGTQEKNSFAKVHKCKEMIECQQTTSGKADNESSLINDTQKHVWSPESMPNKMDDKSFFCDVCNVRCSDKSNLILHQNGRKHRNRVAQLTEEDKKKTAVLIRQQQQIELMKSVPVCSPPTKTVVKNVWGKKSSLQPNYKLPPPPHPVLAQVSPTPCTMPSQVKNSPVPSFKSLSPSSKFTTVAKDIGRARKKQINPNIDLYSSLMKSSPAASNFMTMLNEQKRSENMPLRATKASLKPIVWDTSPSSSRCVPLSVYSAHEPICAPDKALNHGDRSLSISLSDFLTPKKKLPSSKTEIVPWTTGQTIASNALSTPSPKSISQIQAEEENLRSKQDKSYGKGGGSWYIERRERAESVLEIQKNAQEDLEHRLLVEEQLKIEAQIREEINRKQKLDAMKEKSRKDQGASKGRKKKTPNIKKNSKNRDTKIEGIRADAANHSRNKVSNKPANKSSKKVPGKHQSQKGSPKQL